MENKALKVEGHSFISNDKIDALLEIRDLCFLPSVKERKNFLVLVAAAAGADRVQDITESNFGSAYLTAKAILHRIGEDVFKFHKSNYVADVLYKKAITKSRSYQNGGI